MSNLILKAAQESEMIELSDAIQTILDDDEKENDLLPSSFLSDAELRSPRARYFSSLLEESSIENTPHDGRVINSSRSFCRRLESTPSRKRERHLNSVNILCRSKKRRLEKTKSEQMARPPDGLHGRYSSSHMTNSGMRVVEPPLGSSDSGVMVEDATGNLHPAEFVPFMFEEKGGNYVTKDSKRKGKSRLSSKDGSSAQDDSLTNITWLKRMSAPDVDANGSGPSADVNEHGKRPPYSYSALIQFALISTPSGKMTLKAIYDWIQANFPYFKAAKLGWKNSIRHNLSLHKIFIREAPAGHGQPAYWTLKPGTVVRLPENRLFIMEGNVTNNCAHRIPQSYAVRTGSQGANIMRAYDGSRVHLSPSSLAAASRFKEDQSQLSKQKPKPILPRGSTPALLVSTNTGTAQLIPSTAISSAITPHDAYQGLTPGDPSNSRYKRIAPKDTPISTQPTVLYQSTPAVSYDSGLGGSVFEPSDSNASYTKPTSSKRKSKPSPTSGVTPNPPSMSTPLKTPSKACSGLFDNLGCLTPIVDFTDIREGCEDFLSITPIKSTGMTPVIREILNNSSDLELSPLTTSRKGRKTTIPRKIVTEGNEFDVGFNFDDLFSSPERNNNSLNLSNLSFNLFSPQK